MGKKETTCLMSQSHIGDLCKICLGDLFFDDKFVVFHRENVVIPMKIIV